MIWGVLIILIVMGSLGIVFNINVVAMSLIGYLNGLLYYNDNMEIGSIMSLIVIILVYFHLTPDWITQFMAYLIILGFTIMVKRYKDLEDNTTP